MPAGWGSREWRLSRPDSSRRRLCESPVDVNLADATVARIVAPLRACLESAYREGLIRANPASRARLPHREASEADDEADEPQRVFAEVELAAVLSAARESHRPLLELVAGTGLRIGEALALKITDLR